MPLKRFPAVLFSLNTQLLKTGKRSWWLSIILWLSVIAPASAALELRVAIEDGVREVKVGSSTNAIVRDGSGRSLGEIAAMNAFIAEPDQGNVALDHWKSGQIWVEPTGGGYVFIGDRWYRGRVLVVQSGSGLVAVNYVDLEQYLYSVLGGEMNGNWPQESLKAQAVAARSYALYQRQNASNKIYDVGDTAAWQVYDGIEDESGGTQTAVNATASQVLIYNGQIIEAVFHSSAGGCTENVEDVWIQALPYLRSVPDFDQGSPVYQWAKNFSQSELSARITGVGNVIALTPLKTSQCGRIISMNVEGDAGKRTMKGDELRSALGLRSTLFTVVPEVSKTKAQSTPVGFQVVGRGFGHGLGMSQWGAYNLAARGANYQQILLHYYKGTTLAQIQVQ
jgi:stage II sporulation protein D